MGKRKATALRSEFSDEHEGDGTISKSKAKELLSWERCHHYSAADKMELVFYVVQLGFLAAGYLYHLKYLKPGSGSGKIISYALSGMSAATIVYAIISERHQLFTESARTPVSEID